MHLSDAVMQRRRFAALVAVLCAAAVVATLSRRPTASPTSPPISAASSPADPSHAPLLGNARCAECHPDVFREYRKSGHARTFCRSAELPLRERFAGLRFTDPERGGDFHFSVGETGLDVRFPSVFGDRRFPLQFAFGSGEHAVTFVTLLPEVPGKPAGVEHRVSWFSGPEKPGLTPGQHGLPLRDNVDLFGRRIEGDVLEQCFACHTTSATLVGGSVVNLLENVGCEKCHTGASQHVAAMEAGIVEPNRGFRERPWRTSAQTRLCGDCHRSTRHVSADEITRENWKLVRYQPLGMVQSKCYQHSDGKMRCSTCHNPHQHAAQQTSRKYEQKCIDCHAETSQSLLCPTNDTSGCIDCHMPRVEVHPSIAFHDHWIRVRNSADPPAVESAP